MSELFEYAKRLNLEAIARVRNPTLTDLLNWYREDTHWAIMNGPLSELEQRLNAVSQHYEKEIRKVVDKITPLKKKM